MRDGIKKTLWATADKLRANIDTAEYKYLLLRLFFLKCVSKTRWLALWQGATRDS
jgi:type I restriction enzyme M protein